MGMPRHKKDKTESPPADREPATTLVSVKELSRYLNVSRNTILRMVELAQIPYTRVGRQLRFDVVAVRGVLDRNT
jgi:excisionase family DNA binding protein